MKLFLLFTTVFLCYLCVSHAFPADTKELTESKSAFGQPFDEIVVESSLTVKRKSKLTTGNNDQRNARKIESITTKTVQKRQVQQFPHFATNTIAQTQQFYSRGPIGSFGASASGTHSQAAHFGGTNGLNNAAAAFSGTQQYKFNGQTIDIAFGNGFGTGNAGSQGFSISISGPDGQKRPFGK